MLTISPQSFGEWLRGRREEHNLTQLALAEQADCSFSTICKLEAGLRRPSQAMALYLMRVLKVPDEEQPAILQMARAKQVKDKVGDRARSAASSATRRALLAELGGQIGGSKSNDLPAPRTTLIGRAQEVAALQSLLLEEEVRLVTLLGPPGIGKTRLALRVAQSMEGQFPDGVAFALLARITDHRMVMHEVMKALDLTETAGASPLDSLKAYLSDADMLLVLDNFEQVTHAASEVGELLDACPRLKIMVTSRTSLNLYGEHIFSVRALAMPTSGTELAPDRASEYAAIALFDQRSRAANSSFRLTAGNVYVVAEICRRLDGLPLAIELAAARTTFLTPKEILTRLGNGSRLLDGGPADLPARQRSLARAIEGSYNLLDEDEARLFRWLSVFLEAPTLEAIESVCGWIAGECHRPRSALELVGSLASKSLMHALESVNGETLYYMLQTIREYALERLAESGEEYRARESHMLHYAGLVYRAEPYLKGGKRDAWVARLDADYPHILQVLEWCKTQPEHSDTGLHIAWALEWYWSYRNYFSEGASLLAELLAQADEAGAPRESYQRAKALSVLGRFSLLYYDYEALSAQLGEAVELWRALGNKVELAYALANLGAGLAHGNRHLVQRGKSLVEEAVAIFQEANDKWGLAYSVTWLADTYEQVHDWEKARKLWRQGLDLYRELGDSWRGAANLAALGYLSLRDGDYASARRYYGEALTVYRAAKNRWNMASAYRGLGDVELSEGRLNLAGSLYGESLRLYRLHNDRLRTAILYRSLGYVELQKGHHGAAATYFARSVDGLQAIGHKPSVIICLAAFAALAAAEGHLACAARLSALVDQSRERLVAAMSSLELAIYDRNLAHARRKMGEAAFAAARASRFMSVSEAVEHAKASCVHRSSPRG